eukprot:1510-Pelagococcus_subviridis.AAC.2
MATVPGGARTPRKTTYSDRFVPSRLSSAGLNGFNLMDARTAPSPSSHATSDREVRPRRSVSRRARPRAATPPFPSPRAGAPLARLVRRARCRLRARRRAARSFPASSARARASREPRPRDTSAAYSTLLRSEMLGDSAAAAAGLSPLRPSIAFAEPGRQYSYSRCVATPPRGASSETTILRSRATRPDTRPDARVSRVFSFSRRRAPTPRPRSPSPSLPTPSPSRSPNGGARNLFRFKSDAASRLAFAPVGSPYSLSPVGGDASFESASTADALSTPRKSPRKVARSPFKVLDAPALQDDFYLNLVDWSSHNILAVGLGTCVYLWSACTSRVTKLCDLGPNDSVCSVGWTPRGTYLAVGTDKGEVQIWDAAKCKKVRTMGGHRTRVGCLAWSSALLSSGSRDRNVLQRDVRASEHHVGKLVGHKSEVCGLKWSYDDRELASGGNDNQLFIWSANSAHPVLRYGDHAAAVKAIAWSPHQARSSITLVPIRPRSRGERRSLRTFPGVSVRP